MNKAILLATVATGVTLAAAPALAAESRLETGGKVTVRIVGANNGQDVTNGGVSGRGTFTAKGAIADAGTVVAYRTVKGSLDTGNAVITLRYVATGRNGVITFLAKVIIKPTTTTSRWSIGSATKRYKGLHGSGVERENPDHTVVTLQGTVSR